MNLGHDGKYFGISYGSHRWQVFRQICLTGLVTYKIRSKIWTNFLLGVVPGMASPSSALKFPFARRQRQRLTSRNRKFNEQSNGCARALFLHFCAVLCKAAMWNDQVQRSPKNLTMTANLSYFHLDLNAVIAYLAWARRRFQTRAEQIFDNHASAGKL